MLGIVTGFGAEADLLADGPWRVTQAGGRPARALDLARGLAAEGVSGLVSFGIAGGLDPTLRPGTLVLGSSVWSPEGRLPCSNSWVRRLAAALPKAQVGPIAAADGVVATREAKFALFRHTGALAVDLESWAVAEAAAEAGLPFAVIRAVADPARRTLPPAAAEGLDEHGKVRLGAVLLSLARRPAQLPGLIRVGLDTRAALRALAGAVATLEEANHPPFSAT